VKFRFCPKCGGPLEEVAWEDGLTVPQCRDCGFRFYQNSKPCVVGIIVDRGTNRILLTRRGIEPFKGYWDMPGGFLRDGEDPRAGVKREIREELGVECEPEELFDIFVDTYGEYEVYTFNVCYIVRLGPGELTPSDDVVEARWFPLDRVPSKLAFSFLGGIIEKVKAHLARESAG